MSRDSNEYQVIIKPVNEIDEYTNEIQKYLDRGWELSSRDIFNKVSFDNINWMYMTTMINKEK
jgi:hypothetical protein